jgi:hypothetical protein
MNGPTVPGTRSWPVKTRHAGGNQAHKRLKACASHAAARCCRHDSFASPRQAAG